MTSDEDLGGGGVGGGAEGGAARRGHALAVVCTDWCCTDERFRSTRRVRGRDDKLVRGCHRHKLTSLQRLSGEPVKNLCFLDHKWLNETEITRFAI